MHEKFDHALIDVQIESAYTILSIKIESSKLRDFYSCPTVDAWISSFSKQSQPGLDGATHSGWIMTEPGLPLPVRVLCPIGLERLSLRRAVIPVLVGPLSRDDTSFELLAECGTGKFHFLVASSVDGVPTKESFSRTIRINCSEIN